MKRAILIIIKTSLLIFFLYNIGLISFFANFEPSGSPSIKEDSERMMDIEYLNEKINRAKDLGDDYGPEEYFEDLTDITIRENSRDFCLNVIPFVNSSKMELNKQFQFNLERQRRESPKEYSVYMDRIKESQAIHMETVDPGYHQRQLELDEKINSSVYWWSLLIRFSKFLGILYLKNLWIAFLLLWTWWYQEKRKIKIDNPLSFFICLVFYPVVIIRTWKKQINQESRFFAMSIELRRREKNLFSLFSDNEVSELRRLAKSNIKLSDYRLYLDQRGLVRKHSLLPSALVTTLFLALTLTSSSQKMDTDFNSLGGIFAEEFCFSSNAPPVLSQDDDPEDNFSFAMILENFFNYCEYLLCELMYFLSPVVLQGFKNKAGPIPLVVNKYLPILKVIILLTKRRKDEKFHDCITCFIDKQCVCSKSWCREFNYS